MFYRLLFSLGGLVEKADPVTKAGPSNAFITLLDLSGSQGYMNDPIQGSSLAVQWLRLSTLTAGFLGSIPGFKLRLHKPQGAAKIQ